MIIPDNLDDAEALFEVGEGMDITTCIWWQLIDDGPRLIEVIEDPWESPV